MVECPKCDAVIDVDEEELDEGEPLICEECGARLVVVGLDPLEIEEESEAEEDDEEDFDEEFDEEEDEAEEEEEEEDWR